MPREKKAPILNTLPFSQLMGTTESQVNIKNTRNHEPLIEEPSSPEPESVKKTIHDIEDDCYNDTDKMPTIKFNFKELHENVMQLKDGNFSNALVTISPEAALLPAPQLKNASCL